MSRSLLRHMGRKVTMTVTSPVVRRASLPAVIIAALTLTGVAPALGAVPPPPPDSQTGRVGAHHLIDTIARPGATCRYGTTEDFGYYNGLSLVHVRAPVAFAHKGRKSQRIGASVRVQAWDGSAWVPVRHSSWQYRKAKPKVAASFTARDVALDPWQHHDEYGAYRTRVVLRWFRPDGKRVAGQATLFVHDYNGQELDVTFPMLDACGATTG